MIVLFGGKSFEHEISIVSAITIGKKISFPLTYIFLDDAHEFYLIDANNMNAKFFSSGEYQKEPKLTLQQGGFLQASLFKKQVLRDSVLNLIHGGDGEDGTIAALLDFFQIPYIGPRRDASVVSFDKVLTKHYAQGVGVKVVDYEVLHQGDERVVKTTLPFIIKPAKLGSSIGVSVVKEQSELDYALDVAFEFDDTVLIEPFIEGVKEYNLAGFFADDFHFSIVEEPQKETFLDFDKKYLDFSRSAEVSEADISDSLKEKMRQTFKIVYAQRFKGALIRCDFFVIDDEVYLNEINPIPGSMANYLFDDFEHAITTLLHHLPKRQNITVDYQYIHSINSAKGK
jgi:D-alanine-D-alanine ligase